jgi:glycosyltransferase involved in cell wall biosynthesis
MGAGDVTHEAAAAYMPTEPSVLVIHERYRQAGGEDAVVEAETRLLRDHGHRVERLILENDRIPERAWPLSRARLAVGTVWSFAAAELVRRRIAADRPDIVHVHNFLPLLSPSIHAAAHGAGPAVVQTLHNYRLVCPAGILFRDGRPCEDCVGRRVALPAIVHACYRSSHLQSGVVATMLATHAARGTWTRDVDAFIAVSETVRDRVIAGGLPADRVVVKGNFVAIDAALVGAPDEPGAGEPNDLTLLYVGRLTIEKGVDLLLETWLSEPDLPPLVIVGDGPLAPQVAAASERTGRIRFEGRLDRADVLDRMRRAAALVFPSRWYEGQPVTILEALASGLPVIGARIGAMPELVADGETGRLFAPGDAVDFAQVVRRATDDRARLREMGVAARAAYERSHTPEANYTRLMAVYRQVLGWSRTSVTGAGST